MFIAVIRTNDDSVAGVSNQYDTQPPDPPGGDVFVVAITMTEYDDVIAGGLYLPGTQLPRWGWSGTVIVETSDARPILTFVPDTVNAEVGDTVNVDVTVSNGMTGTLDLGVTSLVFASGDATLVVDTVVPRNFVLNAGTNYRVASPLTISVTPLENHI